MGPVQAALAIDTGVVRKFASGATRDTDNNKLDYEGFLSPVVLERYAEYMHKNRFQSDGNVRDSDNWQKGIPKTVYMKSMWRHFFAAWKAHREGGDVVEQLCGVLFNAMGYMHEVLNNKRVVKQANFVDQGTIHKISV